MNEIINKETWTTFFSGYTIYDCAIPRENGFGFLLVEEKPDRDIRPITRFINMSIDQAPDRRLAAHITADFTFATMAASINPPEYVAVDTCSQVYSASALKKGLERPIDQLVDMRTFQGRVGIISKVVRAAGTIYALGNYRKIYRRIGAEQWIELGMEGKGVPLPSDIATSSVTRKYRLADMGAFNENDMYVVGEQGDVWHFDGEHWRNCQVPTNADLDTVCCAGDGLVYLTDKKGKVWAGVRDEWQLVAEADIAPGYQPVDACWFNQRLYLGGYGGLWTIDKERKALIPLKQLEADAPNATTGGRLDISPDGRFLLTAGPYGACLHDGTGWRQLFSAFDFI